MTSLCRPLSCCGYLLFLLAGGCIVSDQTLIEFAIEEDLSGEVVVEVIGIHSDEEDPAKAEKEFEDYVTSKYQQAGQLWATLFGLVESSIVLTNRTATHGDLIVQGGYPNLARSVSAFAGEGNFEIRRTDEYFMVRIPSDEFADEGDDEDEDSLVVAVQYSGTILSHNADTVDPATGTRSWHTPTLKSTGLQFILELPPEQSD